MTRLDRLLLWLGTPLVAGALLWAAAGAARADRDALGYAFAARAEAESTGLAPAGTAAVQATRLPDGVRIDPQTLELVGLQLEPVEGSRVVEWRTLKAYEYQERLAGLPEEIRALDGVKVTMAGFLLPLYEFDDIKEFNLVASHWSCCFGVPPGLSGWVHVKLAPGERGLSNTTEPLVVTGTMRVAEHREAGYVVSIYSLENAQARVIGW